MITDIQSEVFVRSLIVVIFYALASAVFMRLYRNYQLNQKRYEDIILAQPNRQIGNTS